MRNIKMSVLLPDNISAELDAALDAEKRVKVPSTTTREEFAALLIGRATLPKPPMIIPVGPGLLALAQYAHSEAVRRAWVPDDYSLEQFLQDGAYERCANLLNYRMGEFEARELRLLEKYEARRDISGDCSEGRIVLVG